MTTNKIVLEPFTEEEGSKFVNALITWQSTVRADTSSTEELSDLLGGHALGISQVTALIRTEKLTIEQFTKMYKANQKKYHGESRTGSRHAGYKEDLSTIFLRLGLYVALVLSVASNVWG